MSAAIQFTTTPADVVLSDIGPSPFRALGSKYEGDKKATLRESYRAVGIRGTVVVFRHESPVTIGRGKYSRVVHYGTIEGHHRTDVAREPEFLGKDGTIPVLVVNETLSPVELLRVTIAANDNKDAWATPFASDVESIYGVLSMVAAGSIVLETATGPGNKELPNTPHTATTVARFLGPDWCDAATDRKPSSRAKDAYNGAVLAFSKRCKVSDFAGLTVRDARIFFRSLKKDEDLTVVGAKDAVSQSHNEATNRAKAKEEKAKSEIAEQASAPVELPANVTKSDPTAYTLQRFLDYIEGAANVLDGSPYGESERASIRKMLGNAGRKAESLSAKLDAEADAKSEAA